MKFQIASDTIDIGEVSINPAPSKYNWILTYSKNIILNPQFIICFWIYGQLKIK